MNPDDFLLDTDYPIDKIVGYMSGSFSVPAGSTASPIYPHGLSYAPLYYAKWSTDPNFSVSNDQSGFVGLKPYDMTVQSDSTDIHIFALNTTSSSVTLYFRVLFFMPSNINEPAESTQDGLDDFVLNTDYNYTKLLMEGYTSGVNDTINHDLGYYPQVEVWYERSFDSRIVYSTGNLPDGTWSPVASITPTQLILSDSTGTASRWHYKIYADEV